jgi:4-deoxy-L-threo-5-hexosulose-uronate ketol-isomerase
MRIEVRYVADRERYKSMSTRELRESFLIQNFFEADLSKLYYVDLDRLVLGSVVPVTKPLRLETDKNALANEYFAQRRELGVFNIGGEGSVVVDDQDYALANKETLYIGRGHKEIVFRSQDGRSPAKFYLASYPAHASYPVAKVSLRDHEPLRWGDVAHCNKRTLYPCINPKTMTSCQLTMGCTILDEGSNWNTFPSHLHRTRSEAYLYFDLPEDARVFHVFGTPEETRHLVVKNEEVALNPSWSVHPGVGTQSYSFLWVMGGEDQEILSVNAVPTSDLR